MNLILIKVEWTTPAVAPVGRRLGLREHPAHGPFRPRADAPTTPARAPSTSMTSTTTTPGTLPATPARWRPPLAVLAGAVVLGLGWGAATSYLQTVLPDPVAGLANAVSPWLVVPFVVGARSRTRGLAVAAGLLACVLQVAGYYATSHLRGFGVSTGTVVEWAAVGVVGGPVFGLAGHLWRTASGRLRGLGAALLVAVWAVEAVVGYGIRLGYVDDAVVFGAVAVTLLLTVGRRPGPLRATARWLAVTVPVGAVGMLLLDPLLSAFG